MLVITCTQNLKQQWRNAVLQKKQEMNELCSLEMVVRVMYRRRYSVGSGQVSNQMRYRVLLYPECYDKHNIVVYTEKYHFENRTKININQSKISFQLLVLGILFENIFPFKNQKLLKGLQEIVKASFSREQRWDGLNYCDWYKTFFLISLNR